MNPHDLPSDASIQDRAIPQTLPEQIRFAPEVLPSSSWQPVVLEFSVSRTMFFVKSWFSEHHNKISLSNSYSCPFFVTIQLNTLNFLIWESQIVNLIESQGCLGFIDGSIAPPSPTIVVPVPNSSNQLVSNPKYHKWRTDKFIKGWIIGTLSKEILREVVKLNSIVDASKALKNTFN